MTREQAIEELLLAQKNDDNEGAHIRADDIVCEFLTALGYQDVVEEYHKIGKWYA